ncbi:MAG: DUF4091 domain-containing protein [Acidobacteria bacterium]|nr:DUF4091 domain-containing protein [Acidobacteriota bacterium]
MFGGVATTVVAGQSYEILFPQRTGTLYVEFDVTFDLRTEGFLGIARGPDWDVSECAAAVRFSGDGGVEFSGSRPFLPETRISYLAGIAQRFRFVLRIPEGRYDVYARSGSDPPRAVGVNLPFRTRPLSLRNIAAKGLDRLVFRVSSGAVRVNDVAVARYPESGVQSVWAVNDGEKIERDDLNHPCKASNSAWDGKKVRLFGARNEIIAFQLIVEAGSAGIDELSVALDEIVPRAGGSIILYKAPSSDPTDYRSRPIQLFSENYMHVAKPTTAGWIYRANSPSAPQDPLGWKPVQLVPENARQGRGGFPLHVEPRCNQAIWVDVYLGRDLAAGVYDGTINVAANDWPIEISLELEVLDFTLPDENSIDAMVYYESDQPERYQGRNLDPQYHRFAHRQRIELVNAYNTTSAAAAAGRFSGDDFTPARGYEGPGEGIGNRIVPASFYGPGSGWDERSIAWARSDDWMLFLEKYIPRALTFLYMPDEPGPAEYAGIWKIADNIHSNPGPGRRLPIFVTHSYTPGLDGAIDIWCSPPSGFNIARVLEERARGRKYWIYNGGRPAAPAIVIDSPATDPRATIWACFKHEIDVYFYWHSVHWRHNSQMKQGDRNQNVWGNPVTYDNGESAANGDGVLIYPGEEILHPDQDRGIPGPCSTIQLANFRRGLQDHQYLSLARKLGLEGEVQQAIQAVAPRLFSEASVTVGFAETGNAFEEVRYQLGRAIAAAGE